MCSRTVSDTANRLLKRTDNEGSPSVVEEKSSAVPYFRSGCRSLVCARLTNKGKAGVQRGRETAGVPSFLPPPRARQPPALRRAQLPAEVQRKTLRPERANTLAAVRVPRSAGAEKEPPVRGEHACGSSCAPLSRCRERSRPLGANPPAAVRVPRSLGAEKISQKFSKS